jgi:hypothetical protein
MDTVDLIKAVVNSEHGWAVAEQFETTFNGESFEEQNYNALRFIHGVVEDILHSKVLSPDGHDELHEYKENLDDYMVEYKLPNTNYGVDGL